MQDLFRNLFSSESATLSVGNFLLCVLFGFFVGALYLVAYSVKNRGSRSFRAAILLLPAVVAVVILMVNGSIGVGVAIAGAFSLVRFRSAQGTAKEIAVIFMTMCSGLIVGVGYMGYAVLFTLLMCGALILLQVLSYRRDRADGTRTLKITIPENLDYEGVFEDLFERYTKEQKLLQVRSANMGSVFKLTYELSLREGVGEKAFLDELRTRNGNLEVALLRSVDPEGEL